MLKNRVVLVTGGGRGIGRSIALECARAGAHVGLIARTQAEIEDAAREIRAESKDTQVATWTANVADARAIQDAVIIIERSLGPIYGLVCAAGIYGAIGPIEETPPEEWRKAIDINLVGTYNSIYAVVRGMKQRKSGRIVLLSGGGQGPLPHFSAYLTSKGGIWRLGETLGAELAPFGIYINSIAPGAVNTRFLEELLQAGEARVGTDFFKKSLKQKEEGGVPAEKAAKLAVYFLSDRSRGLYGKMLSAVWDPYEDFRDLESLSKSDLFTYRRVVDSKGGTR